MISITLNEKKAAVLDIAARYRSNRGMTEDGVDTEALEQLVRNLGDDRYVLAVVGEAKAGKSTLINALLGEQVLPTDVLQSSSAIIEIFKSDDYFVEAHYADGTSERVYDDLATPDVDEAARHLGEIGALRDKYRKIPTAVIDSWMVSSKIKIGEDGRIAKEARLPIEEWKIESRLPLDDAERTRLVREFVAERSLAQIPVRISVARDLKYASEGFRLVDSPGINAVGGVQDTTFEFHRKADALLFVHSLKNAIESDSLARFINDSAPDKPKEAMFLALTHSELVNDIDRDAKVEEALSIYGNWFDQKRVIPVDSMLQIVLNDLEEAASVSELKERYSACRAHYRALYEQGRKELRGEVANVEDKLRLLDQNLGAVTSVACTSARKTDVVEEIRERANFRPLESAIEELAMRSSALQISKIMEMVKKGYEEQSKRHDERIRLLGTKKENPQRLETEISEIKADLSEYQESLETFSHELFEKYTGVGTDVAGKFDSLRGDFGERAGKCESVDTARKTLSRFQHEFQSLVDAFASGIEDAYRLELSRLDERYTLEHSISVPGVELSGIDEQAREAAYKAEEIPRSPEGFWEHIVKVMTLGLWHYKTVEARFDNDLYLENYRTGADAEIERVTQKGPGIVSTYLNQFSEIFSGHLRSSILSRQEALDELLERKSSNDQIVNDIDKTMAKKRSGIEAVAHIEEILEDLR